MTEPYKTLKKIKADELKSGDILVIGEQFWTVLSLPLIEVSYSLRVAIYAASYTDDDEPTSKIFRYFKKRTVLAYVS